MKGYLEKYGPHLRDLKHVMGLDFVFHYVSGMHYHTGSPKWIKSKKATLNPKESNDNCFQHVITFKLNHEQTKKDPQRLIKIYVFINQYEWKDINFLSHGKE